MERQWIVWDDSCIFEVGLDGGDGDIVRLGMLSSGDVCVGLGKKMIDVRREDGSSCQLLEIFLDDESNWRIFVGEGEATLKF